MKTLEFLFNNTSYEAIREVIIVDDASTRPVTDLLNGVLPSRISDKLKIIRFGTFDCSASVVLEWIVLGLDRRASMGFNGTLREAWSAFAFDFGHM